MLCSPLSAPWTPQEASATYFRVSLLLQAEQEKQGTHQALLRADTTVRGGAGRLSRPCSCRTHTPQGGQARARGVRDRDRGALPSPSIT